MAEKTISEIARMGGMKIKETREPDYFKKLAKKSVKARKKKAKQK